MSTLVAQSTESSRPGQPTPALPRRQATGLAQSPGRPPQSFGPARSRGRLTVAAKVVEKTASQAAVEVADSRGRSGGFLGIGAESDPAARPTVEAELAAEYADLEIKVGIGYPGSLREAAQNIREHVTRRVGELTGVRVRSVDIDISFVTLETDPDREDLR